MNPDLPIYFKENREDIYLLLRRYQNLGKSLLLTTDMWDEFLVFCQENNKMKFLESPLAKTIRSTQEAVFVPPWIYISVRTQIARWEYLRFHTEAMTVEEVTVGEFLKFKERMVLGNDHDSEWVLEIDLDPFSREFPKMQETRSIGRGVEF